MDYGLSIYLYIGFFDSEKVCIKNNISKINEQRKNCKILLLNHSNRNPRVAEKKSCFNGCE